MCVGDEKGIDFRYFNGLYTKVIEDFTKLCHEWDDKSNKLEEEYSSDQNGGEDINIEDGRQNRVDMYTQDLSYLLLVY